MCFRFQNVKTVLKVLWGFFHLSEKHNNKSLYSHFKEVYWWGHVKNDENIQSYWICVSCQELIIYYILIEIVLHFDTQLVFSVFYLVCFFLTALPKYFTTLSPTFGLILLSKPSLIGALDFDTLTVCFWCSNSIPYDIIDVINNLNQLGYAALESLTAIFSPLNQATLSRPLSQYWDLTQHLKHQKLLPFPVVLLMKIFGRCQISAAFYQQP